MSVNILATESIGQNARDAEDRLPALTAGIAVFGLSVLCWAALLLPIYTLLHR